MADVFLKSGFVTHSQSIYFPLFVSITVSVVVHVSVLFYSPKNNFSTVHQESPYSSKIISVRLKLAKNVKRNIIRHKPLIKIPKTPRINLLSVSHQSNIKKTVTASNKKLTDLNNHHDQQYVQTKIMSISVKQNKNTIKQNKNLAPNLEFSIAPDFPSEARWESRTGSTILKYRITILGRVTDIKIKHTSGYQDLDSSAVRAIRQWRYKIDNINPLNWYQYAFHFRLE